MKERLIGAVLLVCGAVLGYLCVYDPLTAAARHSESVSVSMKGAFVCPLLLGTGLLYLLLGPMATQLMGTRAQPRPFAYVFGFALLAAGVGLYFWMRATIQTAGYQF